MPPACASHSAHLHRWSAGLARRLRDGFISDTLRGGYDIFGARQVPADCAEDPDARAVLEAGQPEQQVLSARRALSVNLWNIAPLRCGGQGRRA